MRVYVLKEFFSSLDHQKRSFVCLTIAFFSLTCYGQQTIELNKWRFETGDSLIWAMPTYNDTDWMRIRAGSKWESQGFDGYDGYAWYRVKFILPSSLKLNSFTDSIIINLGKIDDCDQTFLNGKIIGQNGNKAVDGIGDMSKLKVASNVNRNYTLSLDDSRLLWDKENVIAIRVYDYGRSGGMTSLPVNISTRNFKNFFAVDLNPKPLERKKAGMLTKTIILKNLSKTQSIKGKLTIEVTNDETKKVLATQTYDVELKSGDTPFVVNYKGNLLQRVKMTCTFVEASGGEKVSETWANFPKVDFSYAFGTPHRITVGRPTNGNRTLLDLQPGSLRMTWNYMDLSQIPVDASYVLPKDCSHTWNIDINPEIDGQPVKTSTWTRLGGFLPALVNDYNDPHGKFHLEVIGGETATIGRVEVVNNDVVPHQYRLVCTCTDVNLNNGWVDPGRWTADCLYANHHERADRVLMLGIGADRFSTSLDGRAPSPSAVTYFWDLKPGERRMAWIVRPYKAYHADVPALRKNDWAGEFEAGKKEWQNLVDRMKKITIPDVDIINALQASFADIFIMREPVADGYTAILAGTYDYRGVNPSESSIASVALDQFGLHQEAAESYRVHLEMQEPDGEWDDPKGWLRSIWFVVGCKARVIMEHYKLTGDRNYLEQFYPRMLASSRWMEKQRARTRIMNRNENVRPINYGLMPRGAGDCGLDNDGDWFGIFIPHNIWAVYADSLSFEAARVLGKVNDEKELGHIYQQAKNDLLYTMDKGAIQEDGYRWIPGMAGSRGGSRWGVLNASFPCKLLPPNHELITGTLRYMEKNISKGGMPLHTGFMENGSWVAMSLDNVAEAYLVRGNGDKAAHYLYASLNHCTPLFSNVEERGSEPSTQATGGDRQHAWTPIAVVRIIRDMMVMEDGNGEGLNLALGTDRSWLASGKQVGVTDMPTRFGNVTYQMQYDPKRGTITGEIKLAPKTNQQTCNWVILHIRMPEGLKVTSVDKASQAKVLPNGEGIRWKGLSYIKFTATLQ